MCFVELDVVGVGVRYWFLFVFVVLLNVDLFVSLCHLI